jgi:hypothetical protein
MFSSTRRTAAMALLVTTVAGCAGSAPLNPVPGEAPYERELARAAGSITAASALDRIGVIAHDSMGGRNTPSVGLEKTAEYFASKYREWGVQPGGDNGTYFQRYPFVKRGVDQTASWLEANENGTITRYPMGTWAYATIPRDAHITGPIVMFGGVLTPEAIAATDLTGKIAMLVVDQAKAADWARWRTLIAAKNPAAMIQMTNQPAEAFRAAATRSATAPTGWSLELPETRMVSIMIHDSLFANDPGRADRPDFGAMRTVTQPVINPVPEVVTLAIHSAAKIYDRTTVPNVIGIIPGSDPVLRNEYVVFSAHMDHVGIAGPSNPGCRTIPATATTPVDSICNGADDDASGSTGILMVAEAFSRLAVKPKRSIMILHVSGEEKGLLGSRWYSENPTVPVAQIVANVNFDMIGRNNPDSIVVIGKEHSDLGTTLARVNTRHPELRFTTSDDLWPEEGFYRRSDHFNFARKGVPILFFFNGVHEDYHRASDHVEKIGEDKIARVAKTGFYLAAEIANTTARPAWNPESYKQYVEGAAQR